MKHKPNAGVIPPHSLARIDFVPPLTDDEKPMLLTVTGAGTIEMQTPDSGTVLLRNTTPKHAPFVLIVVPQNPSLGQIFDYIRQRLGG